MEIIDRINLCLANLGKTGAEMSRELGLSNSTYSQWNTRKTSPSKKTIPQIAEYLGVTAEYLLTGENGQKETPRDQEIDEAIGPNKAAVLSEISDFTPEELALLRANIKKIKESRI